MTRAPSWVRIPATVLLPAPIPPVSPMIGAAIAAVAIPTRAASRGSPRPRAIETRSSLPHEARQPPPSDRTARGRSRVGGARAAPGLPAPDGAPERGLLFLGYPLRPAGRPERLRAARRPGVALPMLFMQGTRDALCDLERLRPVLARRPRATLHTIEGGDRSYRVPRRAG